MNNLAHYLHEKSFVKNFASKKSTLLVMALLLSSSLWLCSKLCGTWCCKRSKTLKLVLLLLTKGGLGFRVRWRYVQIWRRCYVPNLYILLFLQPPLLPSLRALYTLCQSHFMNFIYWSFCLFWCLHEGPTQSIQFCYKFSFIMHIGTLT
jgi:hypothetical protein